ncbi:hypothetical protein QFZ34_002193 [Phyllobacterium ifriqiyense]|uniref:Uncharacterized protein n=1 Tax=Phyllobacterium ifriqiyense TaxID=314238 RepID=A0ABU0S963_9HYPH|nr:hypothetical protein [Phyllobacterium ifriqiyense]
MDIDKESFEPNSKSEPLVLNKEFRIDLLSIKFGTMAVWQFDYHDYPCSSDSYANCSHRGYHARIGIL